MIRHIMAENQSPEEVAERYGATLEEVLRLNGLEVGRAIPAGLMLWLPDAAPGSARPERRPAVPTLGVPAGLFEALRSWQDDSGRVTLRIVRRSEQEQLTLEVP